MSSVSSCLPLPKNWSKDVTAALLHVIALNNVAIVHGRRPAANRSYGRTRRIGDLQGALDEIALPDEELRVKDGCMAMIDAHRRPRYRPIERMAALELKGA